MVLKGEFFEMSLFDEFLDINPRVEYFPEYDPVGEQKGICFSGIKALAYDGADYLDKHTKVFAHVGFPENVEYPVPAVVLVHGAGGHPEDVWIKKWNKRGYAAIAMDVTGFFPTKPIPCIYEGYAEGLKRELKEPFYEEGYTVSPDNSGMSDCDAPLNSQWMYHAVSQVILAHNILRNDERVDSSQIGIVGISWGGIIASIAIGYDDRFAFAVPIYGSGYLSENYGILRDDFQRPSTIIWMAEKHFNRVTFPVMWLCWNDDCCFSVNSNSLSYLDTRTNNANTCLTMLHNMHHSHKCGYNPMESYWFADEVLKGRGIPGVNAEYADGRVLYSCTQKVQKVRLFYITQSMSYIRRYKYGENNLFMEQDWQIVELNPNENSAVLPDNAVGKYVEFTLENGIILTTPYNE